jgi:hypothetical protein
MYRRHSAATYIMVVNFGNTIWSPPPQLSLHMRAALSNNSNGTRSVYIAERTQKAVYIVICLCAHLTFSSSVQNRPVRPHLRRQFLFFDEKETEEND